jgi:hypothetical protein
MNMASIFSQIGDVIGNKIKQLDAKKPNYFEQADEPTEAKSGDLWRDTDTGVIACLYIEDENRVWMEI